MATAVPPGRSKPRSKSFLARKSTKKHDEPPLAKQRSHTDQPNFDSRSASLDVREKEQDHARPLFNPFAYSIIPDPLNELPSWYHREVEAATASAAQFRARYPIHNPVGPRWYRNHHLLPPTKDGRPPSVFSPSFPPMASAPERAQDPARMAGPSRTPSGSPLPTPTSSQIRIQEPPKPRSRKVSQTAHDNVDMMDGTDPWGTNWHHQSPYDIQSNDRRAEPPSPVGARPRRQSMTNGIRHKTVTPSPLSQSTSAVHLHVLDPADIQLPRKLSKRRKPFTHLFGNGNDDDDNTQAKALRRQSTLAPSMTSLPSLQPSMQKVKRGSVLGRLVKRFSVMRKTDKPAQNGSIPDWPHFASADNSRLPTPVSPSPHPPDVNHRESARLSKSPEPVKRVPPPSIDTVQQRSSMRAPSHRSSDSVSVQEIMTSGRLTIANPDEPGSSGGNTPVEGEAPLPPPTLQEEATPRPMSREDVPLPEIPRTESPQAMQEHPASPRLRPVRLTDNGPVARDVPPPPSSPPLPEIPPPTPTTVLQQLAEPSPADAHPAESTPVPPSPTPSASAPDPPSPAPEPSQLPRPASYTPASPSHQAGHMPSVEDVSLARASLFVNPPTPYAPSVSIPSTIAEVGEATSPTRRTERSPTKSREREKSERDGTTRSKTSISSQSRQTETFRLIRSPSGTIKQAGEVLMGMGEQWEVVESPVEPSNSTSKKSKSSKDKDKEKERSKASEPDPAVRRRDSKQRERSDEAAEQRHRRNTSTGGRDKSSSANSVRVTQTPIVPERATSTKSHRRSATLKKPRPEEGRAAKGSSASAPALVSSPAPSAHAPPSGHERHGSVHASTRPNSELHGAADLASMKAKEAWEMERLWKARSMAYGPDGMPVPSTPATIGSESRPSTFISTELQRVSSMPSVTASPTLDGQRTSPGPVHGSSHTYVVVQTPFQGANGQYAQFASASLYPSGSPPPSHVYPQSHSPPQPNGHAARKPASPVRDPLAHNPLPEPPRLSSYQPAPLPPSLAGSWTAGSP
ncbi:hypothetical protein PYCCODRAFT_1372969 [Trametes coccinea BRFM310]|uniref:Uncharacterized protein n=1 Tax=Trametes coccinea (strain BRFM310) TaxID=1353009 RepID=A0A1Y2IEC8_TRAC3|nr:hypothetical protein PYCCODRAFT_1372969 [Trametes coccinea BRFM310]